MRVVSVAYVGFTAQHEVAVAGSDAADARFWAVDDLAIEGIGSDDGIALAFDHARDRRRRRRARPRQARIHDARDGIPRRAVHARRVAPRVRSGVGEPLHEGNFRRKVLSTPGFVEPTGETAPTDGRPAALYRRGAATQLHPPILRP